MMQAKVMGAPQMFLHKNYPNWKSDETFMVPSIFTGDAMVDDGEDIVYSLLNRLGDANNIGMFVIHGFQLKDLPKFNIECRSKVPTAMLKSGVSDFVIFHHTIGTISIEVVNSLKVGDNDMLVAENKLWASHHLITKLAAFDTSYQFTMPHQKIIALPSTRKSGFSLDDFPSLEDDTLLLFNEDSQNTGSFQKWWQKNLVTRNAVNLAGAAEKAYEKALSYALMIRHLGPVTETDFMSLFREALISDKYKTFQGVVEEAFPEFCSWLFGILRKKDKLNFREGNVDDVKAFLKRNDMNVEELRSLKGMKLINDLLKQGDAKVDDAIALIFEDTPIIIFKSTLRFISNWWQLRAKVEDLKKADRLKLRKKYPFLKLRSLEDLQKLEHHFSQFDFIEGDTPSDLDKELFETLTCKSRMKHAQLPIIMTSDQLAAFEGPQKQLLIGPPGSGKTELMKFKALELELEMKICDEEKRILYIVANGSPGYSNEASLLYYHIKEFFKASTLVDVITVILDNDPKEAEYFERSVQDLTERIESGRYSHVFVDEYWIGSKPDEHKIIKDLITGIPGYVWISSVHDYSNHSDHKAKVAVRTGPVITTLEENGGVVRRITTVLRATNAIIDVLRNYVHEYRHRSYPFGTKEVTGHLFEGLPVTWTVADSVDEMYSECADIVARATGVSAPHAIGKERLALYPDDILIVDFAVRTKASESVVHSLKKRLTDKEIPVWTFEDSLEDFTNCGIKSVTLLESKVREAACFLDGVEWPMVIIILPSDLFMKTAEIASGAQKLRNYDPFISFFRAAVKLVVISDKWENSEDFFVDLAIRV